MRVGLYARVSTERQHERGTVRSQVAALHAAAKADGHEVIEEFIDDGYSGARLDRPALDRLRDAAEAGVLDGVLCLCVDRLARADAYQVLILEELERFGVSVRPRRRDPVLEDLLRAPPCRPRRRRAVADRDLRARGRGRARHLPRVRRAGPVSSPDRA